MIAMFASLLAANDGGPAWLLVLGPAGGGALYFGLWSYYRNTGKSHSFERETRIAAKKARYAAEAVEPGLAAVRRAAAAATGARAMVTGSGSTVIVAGDHASKLRASAEKDVWAGGPLAGCAVVPARFV